MLFPFFYVFCKFTDYILLFSLFSAILFVFNTFFDTEGIIYDRVYHF